MMVPVRSPVVARVWAKETVEHTRQNAASKELETSSHRSEPPRGRDESVTWRWMSPRSHRIRSAAVLGAGTMGAQIAAHLANAGYPVHLLDVSSEIAREGLERARRLKPDPFFAADTAERIRTGGFDSDLERIAEADWIVEAVIEQAAAKHALLDRVDAAATARFHRQLEHLGTVRRGTRRRAKRRFPASLARHAFLQPAALPVAARDHSNRRHRPGRRRSRQRVCRACGSARTS